MDPELQLVVTKCAFFVLGGLIALIACCWIFDCLTTEEEPRPPVVIEPFTTLERVLEDRIARQLSSNQLERSLVPEPLAVNNTPPYGWEMKTMNNEANIDGPPPSYEECCKK